MRTQIIALFGATALLFFTTGSVFGQAPLFDWTFGGGGTPSASYSLGFAGQGAPNCVTEFDDAEQIMVNVTTGGEAGVSQLDTTAWEIRDSACYTFAGWGLGLSHDMEADATQSLTSVDLSEYTLSFDAWLAGTDDLDAKMRFKFSDSSELDESGNPAVRVQFQNSATPVDEQLGLLSLTSTPQTFSTTLDKLALSEDFTVESISEHLASINGIHLEIDVEGVSGVPAIETSQVIGLDADNELFVDNIRLQAPFIELPTITLVGTSVNDNGGTATGAEWLLTAVSGPTRVRGRTGDEAIANVRVPIGTYSLLQDAAVSGYELTSLTCDGSADQDLSDGLDLASGEKVVCTYVNDDISPVLTLKKAVVNNNGGTATNADWTLSAAGPMSISGVDGAETVTNVEIDAGRYTLTESDGPLGYALTSLDCVGSRDTDPSTGLSLFVGEQVTCTFTDDDIGPKLTLQNTVVNDEGGTAVDTDWTLNASGPVDVSGTEGSASVSNSEVSVGTYTLSQSNGPDNYTMTGLTCLGGMDIDPSDGLALALAENVICTFVNDDIEIIEECDPNSQGDMDGNGIVDFADFLVLSGSFGEDVDNHLGGDLDCDGTVGFSDFLELSANFGRLVGDGTCNSATGGDIDGDGQVGFSDFLVMSGNFGLDVDNHEDGDLNCDGTVNFSDFLTISGNFGATVGGADAQSVPEPAANSLMCLASLLVLLVRRRR